MNPRMSSLAATQSEHQEYSLPVGDPSNTATTQFSSLICRIASSNLAYRLSCVMDSPIKFGPKVSSAVLKFCSTQIVNAVDSAHLFGLRWGGPDRPSLYK